jgi:hypothetical protein
MIVEASALADMARSESQRLSISGEVRPAALRASVREAEVLAEDIYEAPAALVYTLARNAPFAELGPMVVAAAKLQAASSGLKLEAKEEEIAEIVRAARGGEKSYEEVRAFFAATTLPFGG